MAPWPEQGSEPKAPDRNKTSDNRTLDHSKSKSEPPEDKKSSTGILKDEDQSEAKKKDVHSLDDGQLKALLDEAIQYKCPKDREGKSKIFRELLQKVEADEIDCNYPVVGIRGSGSRRGLRGREGSKSVTVSERASRGGSLQNIFHASSSSEFDTHHTGGVRRKNKRQGPGSSVSARQREGGSLPSNVNAGWPLESWQSDQIRKKGLFDRDSQQQTHVPPSIGNTAYCNSSSVATASTQARRQTLMHSASNELPSSRKQSPGELYPLRRHHSSSDQSKATELTSVKLKSHSENSSTLRKMPQVSKPEYVSLDMGGLNLETKTLSDSDPALSFEKKLQTNHSERYRITPCEVESENQSSNSQEVFTSRASLEVEPVDSSIEFDLVNKAVNMMNGMEAVQLSENYQSVQCIVGDGTRISDASNQVRMSETAPRAHMYRPLNISLVNISSKTTNDPPRTDENGNALNMSSLSSRNPNTKKRHKRKQLTEKNVVLSQNIEGYRGDKDVEDLLNFIESDKNKNKQLKKPLPKGNKKHEKKRQSIQKSSSLEEISQRNIDDLTESSESERLMNVRKPRLGSNDEAGTRERRSWGDQVYIRSGSQNDLTTEQMEENNSDSEFQMVTKKQRKRKVNEANTKRVRNHRSSRRSPRRKSTSSVPPSERSGDSDLDSVHSLPVGGAPAVSYADIAAGNTSFFTPKSNSEMSTFIKHDTGQVECASVVKNNEIEEWCNSVSQHMEKNTKINSNNNTNNNNNHQHHHNNSNNNNNVNNNNNKNNVNSNNNNNNNYNTSDSKNYTKHENRKQNLDIEENGICDNNIKKLKDLVIVDNSFVDSEVTSVGKVVEVPLKNDIRKNSSNCDVNQCKIVDNKNLETKNKNWNKKNFSREDFPSLPVKSENSSFNNQNKNNNNNNNNKELGEHNASFAKTKQYSSLPDTEKHLNETKPDGNATNKPPVKPRSDDEIKHRRSNRSKSVGPNTRPAVILLHDNERMKDSSVCEITFGFEVNEQLLTSDESSQLLEEDVEVIDETSSSSSKSSSKSGGNGFHKALKKGSDSTLNVDTANSNGGIVYNDVIENRNAYMNSSKAVVGEITNSTVQELFKRHETMSRIVPENKMMSNTSASSIVNKYVPPNAPVQFNHDKIVTFVGMAWEDVMRNGRIQYYRGDN